MASPRTLVVSVLVGAGILSCVMSSSPCPCGQTFDRDPFGSGSGSGFYVGADHDESAHCSCRCGDGPRERLDPSATCAGYEGPCRAPGGEVARYVCE